MGREGLGLLRKLRCAVGRFFALRLMHLSGEGKAVRKFSLYTLFVSCFAALLVAVPGRIKRWSGAMEVCQRANQRFPTRLLRRGCWLLLFALVTVALSASAASAYDLSAGLHYTCAIDDNGVTCWGSNAQGQATVPAGLVNASAITAGYYHSCAIDDNGVTCWGYNNQGQATVPAGLVNPSAIAAGGYHTCALDDNGTTCCQQNIYGQSAVPVGLVFFLNL